MDLSGFDPLVGGLPAWHDLGFPLTSVILRGADLNCTATTTLSPSLPNVWATLA